MRKLVLAIAALSAASFCQGAFLLCANNINTITNAVVTNPTNITCGNLDAGSGNVITTVALRLLGSFNDTVENTLHQVQFDGAGLGLTHSVATGSADFSSSGGPTSGATLAVNTQTFTGGTIAITTTNLGVSPDNASIAVWLEYQTAPLGGGGVPEPSTIALLSSALAGLAWLRRR